MLCSTLCFVALWEACCAVQGWGAITKSLIALRAGPPLPIAGVQEAADWPGLLDPAAQHGQGQCEQCLQCTPVSFVWRQEML